MNDNIVSQETEHVASSEATRSTRAKASCPECGSETLKYGQVGQRFYPQGSTVWSKGHEIHAFVCLECGFVGHYLANEDLGRLESQDI